MDIGLIQTMVHQLVAAFTKFNSRDFVLEKREDALAGAELCIAGRDLFTALGNALQDGIVDGGELHTVEQARERVSAALKHFGAELKDMQTGQIGAASPAGGSGGTDSDQQ